MMGKVRPQIFLAILCLTVLAMVAAFKGMPEISTATIGGIIALGMKVLEKSLYTGYYAEQQSCRKCK